MNPISDIMSDIVDNKSLIRCLFEKNKIKEAVILFKSILNDSQFENLI
jgi:hypothetical protein